MKTVREFTYLGGWVSSGGGCEAAVTFSARCGWVRFRNCVELLFEKMFPPKLNGTVYKSYVRPTIQYGNLVWHMRGNEMVIPPWTERYTVRAICGVQVKDRK